MCFRLSTGGKLETNKDSEINIATVNGWQRLELPKREKGEQHVLVLKITEDDDFVKQMSLTASKYGFEKSNLRIFFIAISPEPKMIPGRTQKHTIKIGKETKIQLSDGVHFIKFPI